MIDQQLKLFLAVTTFCVVWRTPQAGAQAPPVFPESGFNDASGINADPTADSPFTLGASLDGQGAVEPGWAGPWVMTTGSADVQAVGDGFEGDGAAAFFQNTAEAQRVFSTPFTTPFAVEFRVMIPGPITRDVVLRVFDSSLLPDIVNAIAAQVVIRSDFQINVIDGYCDFADDDCVNIEATGIFLEPGAFYDIRIGLDPAAETWSLTVNGSMYEPPDPLDFRGNPTQLDAVRYLHEIAAPDGSYLDSVRVLPISESDSASLFKEIVSGPDRNKDELIDRVIEEHSRTPSEFTFKITFRGDNLPLACIEDSVPSEWQVVSCVPDDLSDLVLVSPIGPRRQHGYRDTGIQWYPTDNDGCLTCIVRTRRHGSRHFEPHQCGCLWLNRGARAVDTSGSSPLMNEDGQPLVSNPLFVAALRDANHDGVIDYTGNGDEDGDGLTDFEECEIGTDPCNPDTDHDRIPDGEDPEPIEKPRDQHKHR